jgi:hypothetical protein
MGSAGRRRHVLVLLGLVLGVAVVALGARLAEIHGYGWEWTLTPSAAPPKVHVDGRDYDRGAEQSGGVPSDAVLRDETPGGGQIFKPGRARGTSTIVYVKDGQRVYVYGLIGGP